jgi:two-component system, sensor histidine kinase LadS
MRPTARNGPSASRRPPWARLAVLLLLALSACLAAAGPTSLEVGGHDRYDISRLMLYMEDRSGVMTIEEASARHAQFKPFPQAGGAYNFGITSSAMWFRITLRPVYGIEPRWLWKVAHPNLDEVDLFVPVPGGGWMHERAGDSRPMSLRLVPHKDHVLTAALPDGEDTTVYMRVASQGALVVPVTLWRPAAFFSNDHVEYGVLSLYFGVLLGLLLYNLLLYFVVRDRAYLVYVAFVASMAMAQLSLTGLAAEFIWRDNTRWNNAGVQHSITLTVLFAVVFVRSFLDSRQHMPRLDRVLVAVAVVWVAQVPLAFMLPYATVARVQIALSILSAAVSAVAGIVSYRQKRPGARYFLLAWGVLFLATCAFSLRNIGLLPTNSLTENALLIGSALEMVLLSFALADRMNVTRRERRRALALSRFQEARRKEAQAANAEKSRFLAAISHDLRQPMYALGLAIDGLQAARLPAPASTVLPGMKGSLSSIHGLLDSLLFMSRLEVGKLEPRRERFDAGQMLDRVRTTFEAQAQAKGLKFTVTPAACMLHSDPVLLERVVGNLVANALRYTKQGGVLVSARPRAGALLVQVWDTGPGIAAAQQEAIFGEYFRLQGDSGDAGFGMGLAIVRSCARLLGCTVAVRSVVGRGSCFSVSVPLGGGH